MREYKKLFPRANFILVEYNALYGDSLSESPEYLQNSSSFYQFVHPLTKQGSPLSEEGWVNLLDKAEINIVKIDKIQPNSLVIQCVL